LSIIPNIFGKKKDDEPKEEVHKLPFNIQFSKTPMSDAAKKERMWTLTNLGKQQLDTLDGSEPEFPYLSAMISKKAWSVDDLSTAVKCTEGRVVHDLRWLEKKGFLKIIGTSGE
jgi:hypothetical protein